MGLHHAGYEVVGFDIKPQPNYPFEFHQQDAFTVDLRGFDIIWASPPCQAYIQRNKNLVTKHPKLIEPVRAKLKAANLPYIIENVAGSPLIDPILLCGTMFELLILRHRLFESNRPLKTERSCNHWGTVSNGDFAAVYGRGGKGSRRGRDSEGNKIRDPRPLKEGPDPFKAMGIDWMTYAELTQAIPPAYSESLGKQLI